jgi:hypothetical protein
MGTQAARHLSAQQARLDAEAERAGLSLACIHQSAEELHHALIGRYLTQCANRRAAESGWIVAAVLLASILILS